MDSGAGPGRAGEGRGKDSGAGPGGGAGRVLPGGAVIQMTVGVLHSASPRGIQKLGSFVWTPESLTARGVPKCLLGRRRPETGLN